jgi:hypothetical protein
MQLIMASNIKELDYDKFAVMLQKEGIADASEFMECLEAFILACCCVLL